MTTGLSLVTIRGVEQSDYPTRAGGHRRLVGRTSHEHSSVARLLPSTRTDRFIAEAHGSSWVFLLGFVSQTYPGEATSTSSACARPPPPRARTALYERFVGRGVRAVLLGRARLDVAGQQSSIAFHRALGF